MQSPQLLCCILALFLPCLGADKLDEMLPKILARLHTVRDVLAPLPKDILEEAIYHAASYYIPLDSETELCQNHSSILFDSFLNNDLWALRLVDASSKGGAGMLDGNFMDLGNYGQCVSVQAPGGLFTGQHCVVETRGILPPEMDSLNPTRPVLPTLRIDLMFSVCVPSSCTVSDVKTHLDLTLSSVNATAIMYDSSCSSSAPIPFQKKDYVTIVVLVLIAFVIALSSYFDNQSKDTDSKQLLLCFSLRRNFCQLLTTKIPAGQAESLTCLHGLRFLAMAWMMQGYRMLHLLASPNFRLKYLAENIDSLYWAPVENAQLSVEIFFLVTGVLVTYNFFLLHKKGKKFSYIRFFFQHYIRLTPPLALMTLFYATIAIQVTDGPIWRRLFQFQQEFCQKHWWTNILYISNFINPYEMCIPQTWYLAIEFQLYVFAPLLLLPLRKNTTRGFLYIGAAFLATIVGGMINAYVLEIQAGGLIRMDRTREGTNVLDYFYTQYRAASFLMGMALGFLLFKVKQEQLVITFSRSQLLVGWTAAVILVLTSVFSVSIFQDPEYVYTPWLDTAYGILHRPALSFGVCWVVLVCSVGYGGIVNDILSWKILTPFSRLTYCVFLVHFFIQDVQAFSTRTAVTTDFLNLWYTFVADLTFSVLLAAVMHLTVEAPINNIVSLICSGEEETKETAQMEPPLTSVMKTKISPETALRLEKF